MMYAGIVRENLEVYGELRDRIYTYIYKYVEWFTQIFNVKAAIEI